MRPTFSLAGLAKDVEPSKFAEADDGHQSRTKLEYYVRISIVDFGDFTGH